MKNPETNTKASQASNDLLDKIEAFLEKNRNILLGISILITALLCYLLFDARMSFATDDSEYVKMSWNLLYRGAWPTYHGTLYPVMLAGLYKIFGLKVVLFKFFSAVYYVLSIVLFFRAFRGRVPYIALFATIIYLCINSYFLYFSSQTFSEAFTLFLQALAFVVFLNHIHKLEKTNDIKQNWKSWLLFGLMILILSITKNILIITLGGAVLYFLIYKQWMSAVWAVVSFAIFKLPYELFIRTVFHGQTTSQLDQIMLKNFYNPAEGYEDFPGGYIDRLFTNFNNFISVQVYKVMGLRNDHPEIKVEDDANAILSLLFVAIIIISFIFLFKKNKYLVFSLIFATVVWCTSFAAIQTNWSDQWRLIVPYVPYFLIAVFGAFWYQSKIAKQTFFKPILVGVVIIFLIIQLPRTSNKVSANGKGLKHYAKGDMKYGVPEQYNDFVTICDSISSKVPSTAKIAARQPGEAFVYSGMPNFERIGNPGKTDNADSVLARLKKQGITHLLISDMSGPIQAAEIIAGQYPEKLVTVLPGGSNFYQWLISYSQYMQQRKTNREAVPPAQPAFLLEVKY